MDLLIGVAADDLLFQSIIPKARGEERIPSGIENLQRVVVEPILTVLCCVGGFMPECITDPTGVGDPFTKN
jgi:hypothetical protein